MSMVVADIGGRGDLLPWSSIFLFMTDIKHVASNKRFIEELGAGGVDSDFYSLCLKQFFLSHNYSVTFEGNIS